MIRSPVVTEMPEKTTVEDLDAIEGALWTPLGVLRDVLPDIPRPTLTRDEPPFQPVEERPVARNVKISQEIVKKFGCTPGCVKCRKWSRNCPQAWHTLRSVEPKLRRPAARLCVFRSSRASRTAKVARVVERNEHASGSSAAPRVAPGPTSSNAGDTRSGPVGEEDASAQDARRARGEPVQDSSVEMPFPSADETSATSGVTAATPDSNPSGSPSVSVSPGVSSSIGVKRGLGESAMNDYDQQPATRARIAALVARLHGVDSAEGDETNTGEWIDDEWMSPWDPEPLMDSTLVHAAKRKELDRFKRMTVYRVVKRRSMEKDADGKMISAKSVVTNKGKEPHPIAKARLVAREI